MLGNRKVLTLIEKRDIATDTLELVYESEDNLAFLNGQFFSFHLTKEGEEKVRSYSAANVVTDPRNNRLLSIAVTLYPEGFASGYFINSRIGDKVEVSGPYGNLIWPKQVPPALLMIATGTGIAPFRSMSASLEEVLKNGGTEVTLAFGVKGYEYLMYDEVFLRLADLYPQFNYRVFLSQQEPTRSFEEKGRVTQLLTGQTLNPNQTLAYVCGNPSMVDDVVAQLEEQGLATPQIKREKYTMSKL
jgi:ferredoxin-NADP reductase